MRETDNSRNKLLIILIFIFVTTIFCFLFNHVMLFLFSFLLSIFGIVIVLYKPKYKRLNTKKNNLNHSYFHSLFNHLSQPIIIIKNDNIVYYNSSFSDVTSIRDIEINGLNINDIFSENNINLYNQFIYSDLTNSIIETELKLFNKIKSDFSNIKGKVSCVKFTHNQENYIQISLILDDITSDISISKEYQILTKENLHIKTVFNSLQSVLICSLDTDFKMISFNNTFFKVFTEYFNVEPKVGESFIDYLWPFVRNENYHNLLNPFRAAADGKFINIVDVLNSGKNKEDRIWLNFTLNPIDFGKGVEEITCGAIDITSQKNIEEKLEANIKEKEILIKEIHHRVKNNLQIISSLLNLQNNYVTDPVTDAVLTECQNRVKAISYVHESLYTNDDFTNLKIGNYVQGLVNNLRYSFTSTLKKVDILYEIDESFINLDYAISLGLIINELVTNSFKYAFNNQIGDNEIYIKIYKEEEFLKMIYSDNGIGFDKNINFKKSTSLGIELIHILTEQLQGNLTIENNNGVKYLFNFDLK